MRWTHVLSSILALCCCVLVAAQATLPVPEGSYTTRSRHYELVTDLPRERARELAAHMDAVNEGYAKRMSSFRKQRPGRSSLAIFAERDTYLEFLRGIGIDGTGSGGMFISGHGLSVLATWINEKPMARTHHVLQHEGLHQFVNERIGSLLPIWANEGLAEYFGEALMVRGRLKTGIASQGRIERIRDLIEEGEALPFEMLIRMTNEEWLRRVRTGEAGSASVLYDQSWAMVHFLVHGDGGRYRSAFEDYLKRVSRNTPSTWAFRDAFGSNDLEPFQKAWERFVLEQWNPDPLSTGVERLEFLAEGINELAKDSELPPTLGGLRSALVAMPFVLIRREHGVYMLQSAEQDELFEAPKPQRRGRRAPTINYILQPGAARPELSIEGLSVPVRIEWNEDGLGGYEIVLG
ncbi:MAG: DUF1570 domain-containing protein [Planctomycetota bacterium]